jgi:hypothetical protein
MDFRDRPGDQLHRILLFYDHRKDQQDLRQTWDQPAVRIGSGEGRRDGGAGLKRPPGEDLAGAIRLREFGQL